MPVLSIIFISPLPLSVSAITKVLEIIVTDDGVNRTMLFDEVRFDSNSLCLS